MAVEVFQKGRVYRVLAADTKPTNPSYHLLVETDTGLHFCWNGTAWVSYVRP
jgi:hypothetical protein